MIQPKVSIIIPVYNTERYLERCINSLRNQTLSEVEIILVDDASSDNSPEICDLAAAEDFRIKVIHKENEGAGMARNAALKFATGKYVGFIDSDDFAEPSMFETLYDTAEKYNADLVMSGVIFQDGNMFSEKGTSVLKTYFEADTHFETDAELMDLRIGIIGSMPGDTDDSKYGMSIWKNLFRREIIVKNNLMFRSEREVFSEDALFMIDYIAHIKRATGIKEAFYNYCRNDYSISKSYQKDKFEKILVFVQEVERRLHKDILPEMYQMYLGRFWQAMCRVVCAQEIMYAMDNGIKSSELKKRLQIVCAHSMTKRVLKTYPIWKLPLKQAFFAFGIKHELYALLKLLVGLRR